MAEDNIEDLLRQFTRKELDQENIYTIIGKATNVSESKRTCDLEPFDETAKRSGCRLQGDISLQLGFVQIPKENSTIAVTFFDNQKGYVSLFAELEKIIIDTELVQFNGGILEGITKVNDVVARMNIIENDLNTIKAAFTAWLPVAFDGGASLKAITTTWFGATLTPTVKDDIEDPKITH